MHGGQLHRSGRAGYNVLSRDGKPLEPLSVTYTPPEGVTIGSFTADALPASFTAPADSVISYKIYGTEAGAGVETENIFNLDAPYVNNARLTSEGDIVQNVPDYCVTAFISVQPNTRYAIINFRGRFSSEGVCFYNENQDYISGIGMSTSTGKKDFTTPENCKYIRLSEQKSLLSSAMITLYSEFPVPYIFIPYGYKLPLTMVSGEQSQDIPIYIGSTKLGESEYVDYESGKIYKLQDGELTPTDPPVSLPTITATGETTISSTETLGDVELTGEWSAIMGSTEAESIDIGFTVVADEYIAFVTVDDGPSIQVSDTITMPSSADSFTLDAVAWGRERYTDTVYNALS